MSAVRQWTVGKVRVSAIAEVAGHTDPISVLISDATPEWLLSYPWLRPHFVTPEGRMIITFQAFLVETPSTRIMVDTCIGNDRARPYEVFCNLRTPFLETLASLGCPPETIDIVLCTHLHFDHVGWNTHLVDGRWVPTFRKARYLFGVREWEHGQALVAAEDESTRHFADCVYPVVDAGLVDYVGPEHRICEEIRLIPTPGHTPGHVSVLISSEGHDAIITGDAMHHPVQCAEPERHGNFDHDKPLASATRRQLLELMDRNKLFVIGSHFPDPTAGWVERDGPGWRFRAME